VLVPPSYAWKLVLAIVLGAAIVASAYAKAPSRPSPRSELRRLVLGALALYAVGLFALLRHQAQLAVVLYAAGVAASALAAWLSRGTDSGGGPAGDEPVDEHPPPTPDDGPRFDWETFERDFQAYADRRRDPAQTR
jgi:4-amino-4-deoxy-L-arabinose transferase-like glycosyltransferase